MIRAAGVLFVTPENRALFLKRGPGSDHPNEWAIPGGQIEGDELPEDTARRETREETGHITEGELIEWARRIKADEPAGPEVDFTTFIKRIPAEFTPELSPEHTGYAWTPVNDPPEPLHPGCRVALDKLSWDELGIARALAAGDLTSPQRYDNIWLFDLRITGTGTAYRRKLDEFVYRHPENYLTQEFLDRCNGLPVIWKHPKTNMLDAKEFADRAVGAVMLPYIKGDEVWGVAKIYDDEVAELMDTRQLSTSPAVVFRDVSVNAKVPLPDGSTLLIEGKPSLLDHLAICEQGVWDKGGDPAGVRSEAALQIGDSAVAEKTEKELEEEKAKKDAAEKEEKERADAARRDAEAGEKLDKVLSHLDSVMKHCADSEKRMDAMHARMDAWEDEKKKADAEKEVEGTVGTAADKAKKDAEEEEAKKKADAARADSNEGLKKQLADLDAKITGLAGKVVQLSDEDRAKFADVQARADSVFNAFGGQAPQPLQGEALIDYRRRLVGKLKEHSAKWKAFDLNSRVVIGDDAIPVIEEQVYGDAMVAARNPVLPAGVALLERVSVDRTTGLRKTEFFGPRTIFGLLGRPARQVTRISPAPKS